MRLFSVVSVLLFLAAPCFSAEPSPVSYRYAVVLDEGMNSGKLYLPHVGERVQLTLIPLFLYDMPAHSIKFENAIRGKSVKPGDPLPSRLDFDFDEDSVSLELIADGRAAILEFVVPSDPTTINVAWGIRHWDEEFYLHRKPAARSSLSISPMIPFSEFVNSFGLPQVPTVNPDTQ